MASTNYRDFENVTRRYHQGFLETELNWAFAGGAAVKILLDADEVHNREIRNNLVEDCRNHKDIEMYLFRPVFGDRAKNPHDLFFCMGYRELESVDYQSQDIPGPCGIWYEVLKDHYFDFVPPTLNDVVRAQVDGDTHIYHTLSPEYLLASKVLSSNGQREDDTEDAVQLLRKFSIDFGNLNEILARTDFRDVARPEELESLEETLQNEEFFGRVSERIIQKYQYTGVADYADLSEIDYSSLLTLLKFTQEELKFDTLQHRFISGLLEDQQRDTLRTDSRRALALAYVTPHLDINYKKNRQHARHLMGQIDEDAHRGLAIAFNSAKVLKKLRTLCKSLEPEYYNKKATQVMANIGKTPFLHVMAAKMDAGLQRIIEGKQRTPRGIKLVIHNALKRTRR